MPFTASNFIGTIVCGRIREQPGAVAFDVDRVLGTGFVVSPEAGVVLTCEHVLPQIDRESGRAFAFYTVEDDMRIRPFLIDCSSAVQWPGGDIVALKLRNPSDLKTLPVDVSAIGLADQVVAVGFPLNHMSSSHNNFVITPRAFVSHVVSGYVNECEVDKPFIVTMSGSPMIRASKIVGICFDNREYAINQYQTEQVDSYYGDRPVRTQRFEYSEVSRFGVFYKAAAWSDWLSSLR